ncbi:MAG: hypothetical protein HY055_08280 [Magnetospirillum sp.]|uniref:Uncharacterized protein n=1 Tax=Paramagnetospirillum magnetotacticum MS-1 TaxID=272627 RepID=A0A0C2YWK9_PARME|nr:MULTISPECIES: hypothetical protein [Rhodospirillales]KIL99080.1 hypothetical protein CCC_01873 [Paramagnetospirillum magnetotacticum MS-1]MBI3445348.1 hypothetical protein [Magnetospirillum sp.]
MKKLMIAAAVLAAIAVAPAFAQTKSEPLDPHTFPSGGDHQMNNDTKPAYGAKNIPVDTHSQIMTGPEHQMGPQTKPAHDAKNVPLDPHTLPSGGDHQMPVTPPAKK